MDTEMKKHRKEILLRHTIKYRRMCARARTHTHSHNISAALLTKNSSPSDIVSLTEDSMKCSRRHTL